MALGETLAAVFASKKAIDIAESVAKKAPEMVDNMFHTDQEKSQANLAWFGKWCEMMVQIKDENTARSITRRILAMFIIVIWAVFCFCGLVDIFLHLGNVDNILSLADALYVALVTGAVITFYFGVSIIDRFRGGK